MVEKSIPRFTKSPSLVLIGLVLTEIQAFKNVKYLQRNVWKTGQIRTNDLTNDLTKTLGSSFLFLSSHRLISIIKPPNNIFSFWPLSSKASQLYCLMHAMSLIILQYDSKIATLAFYRQLLTWMRFDFLCRSIGLGGRCACCGLIRVS